MPHQTALVFASLELPSSCAALCRPAPLHRGLGAPRSLHRPYKRYPPGDTGHIDLGDHFAVDESTYVWGLGHGTRRQGAYGSDVPYPLAGACVQGLGGGGRKNVVNATSPLIALRP